jgi:hypothetical protein
MHPEPTTGVEILLLKLVVLATIIGGLGGALISYAKAPKYMRWVELVAGLLIGAIIPPAVALLVIGVVKGIQFVFN